MRFWWAFGLLAVSGTAHAHRLDEYLQATLIGVSKSGIEIEISLTPGVAVLPVVLAIIDLDHDGRISTDEQRAYVERVRRDVSLLLDNEPVSLTVAGSSFPDLDAVRGGLGTIRIQLRTSRSGRKLRFENRHIPQISAYLVNCLAAPDLLVGPQVRDEAQKSIGFEYSFAGTVRRGPWLPEWLAVFAMMLATVRVGLLVYRRRFYLR